MKFYGTTIVAVKRGGRVAIAGDGQVTMEHSIFKHRAVKVRRMYHNKVVAGFAGSAADALSLFERFESKLEETRGQIRRAAVEFTKDWRTDRVLRRLEALMLVTDGETLLLLSGNGDIIEPDDGVIGIGSGGPIALGVARALLQYTELPAEEIARIALKITSDICIYTNDQITIEVVEPS